MTRARFFISILVVISFACMGLVLWFSVGHQPEATAAEKRVAALHFTLPPSSEIGPTANAIENFLSDGRSPSPARIRSWAEKGGLSLGFSPSATSVNYANYGRLALILDHDALQARTDIAFQDIDAAKRFSNVEATSPTEIDQATAAQTQLDITTTLQCLLLKDGSDPVIRSRIQAETAGFDELPASYVQKCELLVTENYYRSVKTYIFPGFSAPSIPVPEDWHITRSTRNAEEADALGKGLASLQIVQNSNEPGYEKVQQLKALESDPHLAGWTYHSMKLQLERDSAVQLLRTAVRYLDDGGKPPVPETDILTGRPLDVTVHGGKLTIHAGPSPGSRFPIEEVPLTFEMAINSGKHGDAAWKQYASVLPNSFELQGMHYVL